MEAASITETASAPPPSRRVGDVLNTYALPILLVVVIPILLFVAALVGSYVADPTLWVRRRSGVGWTVDPMHPWAGWVHGGLIGVLIISVLLGAAVVRITGAH